VAEDADAAAADDAGLAAHRFSQQAFQLAKRFVDDGPSDGLRAEAAAQQERLPALAEAGRALPDAEAADVNRTLADARLDLAYVLAGGGRPSSTRLARYEAERGAGDGA
jgi:hypothetical protein